jgi:hypothetical protein
VQATAEVRFRVTDSVTDLASDQGLDQESEEMDRVTDQAMDSGLDREPEPDQELEAEPDWVA